MVPIPAWATVIIDEWLVAVGFKSGPVACPCQFDGPTRQILLGQRLRF